MKIISSCEFCDKIFSSKQSKSRHVKIVHGEEKTIGCNMCSRIFGHKQKGNENAHISK